MTQLEYRGEYFVRTLSKIIAWSTGFIMVMVLLTRFQAVGGWTVYEVLFLYALNMLTHSLAGTFFMNSFENLPRNIRQGVFDGVLTKPVSPLFYYVCTNVSAGYTSNYVIGVSVLVVCFAKLSIPVTLLNIVWLIAVILGGCLIQAAGFILTNVPAFWILKSESLMTLFFDDVKSFLQYPITIYAVGIQVLVTFVLPYAFISFYPAQYFLGREDALFHPLFQYLTLPVGALLYFVAVKVWNIGINRYNSTGS
jgi:ABC-2 type transport system permease protein